MIGLIVLWTFPVAFVGLLSNVSSLCAKVHWLAWICRRESHLTCMHMPTLPESSRSSLGNSSGHHSGHPPARIPRDSVPHPSMDSNRWVGKSSLRVSLGAELNGRRFSGLAWYENIPRWSLISLSVYKRYYIFLIFHGFLVVTLSSGLTASIPKVSLVDPD